MSAPVIPEGLEPLAVWGPHTPGWAGGNVMEKIEWAKAHIPNAKNALRAELYQTPDGPVALMRYFAPNPIYPGGPRALEPPVVVPLAELPPAHLLRAA